MRSIIIFLIGVLLVFGFSSVVSCQSDAEKEESLRLMIATADSKLKQAPYREEQILEYFADKDAQPTYSNKFIKEFVPPDRFHYISKNGESISIGSQRYSKVNGTWQEDQPPRRSGYGNGAGYGSSSQIRTVVVIETKKEHFKGKKAIYYAKTTTTHFTTKSGEYESISTNRYWFDGTGRYLKKEFESSSTNSKQFSHNIFEYEYNSNVKVETPIP